MANQFVARKGLIALDDSQITGSLDVSGSITLEGSGSTLFKVNGSEGQLFSITDSLSGSLFAVSDVSGLPILEVFSDDTVKIGSFNNEAITVNGSTAVVTGSFTGSFVGDGSNLTGISSDPFPYTGDVIITGSNSNAASASLEIVNSNEHPLLSLKNDGTLSLGHDVLNTTTGNLRLINRQGDSWMGGQNTWGNISAGIMIQSEPTNPLYFRNLLFYVKSDQGAGAGVEKMRFDYNGNLGIGTSSPQERLHVNGNAVITGSNSLAGSYALKVTNTSGADILNVENDGNVGLGVTDPSYKLQVRGDTNDDTDYPFRVENSSGTPLFRVRSDGYVMFGNLGEDLAFDFTGGNRYLKFFNTAISAQGDTGITATGTITLDPGSDTSARIAFIRSANAYGSVFINQGTAADTTFPNNRGTEILFNRDVNHQKHYGVIRGDDNQYQPVPIYIFSGQHTTTSVTQPLILQHTPGGDSRGNVGIGLDNPQTNLHVSSSVSASTYYGDGSNLTGIDSSDFSNLPTSDPSIAGRLFQTSSDAIGASAGFQVVLISQG